MNPNDVATPDYRAVLQQRYTMPGWGASGYSWAPVVRSFAHELDAESILDYGCGRGTLRMALPGWDVREYDPGIVGKDIMPKPADLVVATDVLEHIEPELLDNVLLHLRGLARKGLFLNIATRAAKEILPDGRNAHLIIQPPQWWKDQLVKAGLWPSRDVEQKGYNVWIKLA
jgi:hypothetical protein